MSDDEKISSLYKQGNEQGPPTQLDDVILTMARAAVHDDETRDVSVKIKGPFSGGWPAPVSIAAVLIITVILVPLLQQEEISPTISSVKDDESPLMMEQDAVDRFDVDKEAATMYLDTKLTEKKRLQEQVPGRQTEPRLRSPLQTAPVNTIKAKSLRSGKQMMIEEAVAPMRSNSSGAVESLPSVQKKSSVVTSATLPATQGLLATDNLLPEVLDPTEWLQNIRQLIDQGDSRLAKQELDKFKEYYPDEKVDQSILQDMKQSE